MKILDKEAERVLDFWFTQHSLQDWFSSDPAFDRKIQQEFNGIHMKSLMGELYPWRVSPHGALAEIIILDQFSRNIYRDDIRSYLSDDASLVLAQNFIKIGYDEELFPSEKLFAYMPFMHSESLIIQKISLELYKKLDHEEYYKHAQDHYNTIQEFGRFPSRNALFKRESTPEEIKYLESLKK